jgi:hypothetical protein
MKTKSHIFKEAHRRAKYAKYAKHIDLCDYKSDFSEALKELTPYYTGRSKIINMIRNDIIKFISNNSVIATDYDKIYNWFRLKYKSLIKLESSPYSESKYIIFDNNVKIRFSCHKPSKSDNSTFFITNMRDVCHNYYLTFQEQGEEGRKASLDYLSIGFNTLEKHCEGIYALN